MKKNSKIAVFGVSGLVGSAIVRKLLENDYINVVGTYHKRKPDFSYSLSHTLYPIHLISIDLTSQQQVEQFFQEQKPEYVFLAAAKVGGIMANNTYKADFIYINTMIAANVINAAYKYKVKKLLNLGSSCIYPKFAPQPIKEEHLLTGELEPTNEPYAIAKITAIKLCRYYNEQYGTNFISTMPTNLYGPNDNFDLYTSHVLAALIRKIHLGKLLESVKWEVLSARKKDKNWEMILKDLSRNPLKYNDKIINENSSKEDILKALEFYGIKLSTSHLAHNTSKPKVLIEIWGTGKPLREFLYIEDMVEACVFLMENVNADDMRKLSKDYFVNLGVGEDISIKDLAYLIKEVIGFKGKIEHDLTKPDGTPRKLLDVGKINKLGWKAKTSLEDGIKKTYEWYLGNY